MNVFLSTSLLTVAALPSQMELTKASQIKLILSQYSSAFHNLKRIGLIYASFVVYDFFVITGTIYFCYMHLSIVMIFSFKTSFISPFMY